MRLLRCSIFFIVSWICVANLLAAPMPATQELIATFVMPQGDIESFALEKYFPSDVVDYKVQVANDPHQVIATTILDNVIYIMTNPYDFSFMNIAISDNYQLVVTGIRANKSTITRKVNIRRLDILASQKEGDSRD